MEKICVDFYFKKHILFERFLVTFYVKCSWEFNRKSIFSDHSWIIPKDIWIVFQSYKKRFPKIYVWSSNHISLENPIGKDSNCRSGIWILFYIFCKCFTRKDLSPFTYHHSIRKAVPFSAFWTRCTAVVIEIKLMSVFAYPA